MAEAFICDGIRTPIGRYGGGLAKVRTDDLAAVPLKALMKRHPTIDWSALDMVYFDPWLSRQDGKPIGAANVSQALDGKSYQRWSRHRTGQNPWKPGEDSIGTHIFLIEDWLQRIRQRRDDGDLDGARSSLMLFRREHPHHRVPDDLRALPASEPGR